MRQRYYAGLIVSLFLIGYGIWKLNRFFAPKVGPVGNGPSETLINVVWILFSMTMILGIGGAIYFTYSIFKKK